MVEVATHFDTLLRVANTKLKIGGNICCHLTKINGRVWCNFVGKKRRLTWGGTRIVRGTRRARVRPQQDGGGARAACSVRVYARLPRPDRRGYYKNRVLCTLVVAEDSEIADGAEGRMGKRSHPVEDGK